MKLFFFDPRAPWPPTVLARNINTILNNWAQVLWLDSRGML
jgi:hypothetical protein